MKVSEAMLIKKIKHIHIFIFVFFFFFFFASIGKFDEAKKVLQETTQRITSSVSVGEEFCQGLLSDLTNAAESMRTTHHYKSHGAHYMMSK